MPEDHHPMIRRLRIWIVIALLAVASLVIGGGVLYYLPVLFTQGSSDPIQAQNDARPAVATMLLGLAALATVYLTARTFLLTRKLQEAQAALADQGQRGDQFAKLVDQLGNRESLHVRLGAVYGLERLAKNHPTEIRTVVLMLGAFARFPVVAVLNGRLSPDVQAAVGVLARSLTPGPPCNLAGARLVRAGLWDAKLKKAYLIGATLEGSELKRADLREAKLGGANLRGADLEGADLRGADLRGTNLKEANLENALLSGTEFDRADMTGALLGGALLVASTFDHTDYGPVEWGHVLGLEESAKIQGQSPHMPLTGDVSSHGRFGQPCIKALKLLASIWGRLRNGAQ